MHRDDFHIDFATRLASRSMLPVDEEKTDPNLHMLACCRSLHISTIVHGSSSEDESETSDIDMAPPLTRGNSNASSPSDLGTDVVSVVDGGFVLESQNGILVLPNRLLPGADLLCPFQVLDCQVVFADVVEFKSHFFSHFRGHHLPQYATCFLCGVAFFQPPERDPSLIWNNMLDHMIYDHFRAGEDMAVIKADVALMRYMWNRGLVSHAQLKRSQLIPEPIRLPGSLYHFHRRNQVPEVPMAPPATPPVSVLAHLNQSIGTYSEAVVINAGRRAERRQRDNTSLRARIRSH